jgi:hypothetical protein
MKKPGLIGLLIAIAAILTVVTIGAFTTTQGSSTPYGGKVDFTNGMVN